MYTRATILASLSLLAATAIAEQHTIKFTNKCGKGTPTLTVDGTPTKFSGSYTSNGPVEDFNAFLELTPGACGTDGRSCPYVSGTLQNSGLNHASLYLLAGEGNYTVATGWDFQGGGSACNGKGQDCTKPQCPEAVNILTFPGGGIPLRYPGVNCTGTDVNIEIKFCE